MPAAKPIALRAALLLLCGSMNMAVSTACLAAPHAKTKPKEEQIQQPILLDTIVATVDEKPITLRDLEKRLTPPRKLTLDEASKDPEVQTALERMIFEEVILSEAATKKINVDDQEVDRYLTEVAKRNNLTKDTLLQELSEQHRDIADYRRQIKIDILQSRLGSSYLQNSGAVSQEEVDAYLQQHPELSQNGSQVKLSRIFITADNRTDDEAKARAEQALKRLKDGDAFADVARELSDGPEAADGGSMGLVAEKDLSPDIFDATLKLSKGEVSEIVKGENNYQIFKVEDRITSSDTDQNAIVEEVKRRLQQEKQQSKIQGFFAQELFKNHTIERKI